MRLPSFGEILQYYYMKSLVQIAFFYAFLGMVLLQNCSTGCLECDPTTKMCKACLEKYELTILGDCVGVAVNNCNLYLNSSYCLRCQPTYFLENNICVKDASGCYKNITSKRCGLCSPELTLLNSTCVGVFNCLNYTDTCHQCDSGFTLLDNICIANSDNCLVVSRGNGVCVTCRSNYSLVGYKCISNLYYSPNCEIYDKIGRCSLCKEGYILYQASCFGRSDYELIIELNKNYSNKNMIKTNISESASNNISNARTNSNDTSTIIPESFPQLNITNVTKAAEPISTPRDSYCKIFQSSACISCYSNFNLIDGTCQMNNPLCKLIYANGSCKSCYEGYQTEGETCILISEAANSLSESIKAINEVSSNLQQQTDPYCISYKASNCVTCANGFAVSNSGTCSIYSSNCLSYNLTSKLCILCNDPYMLINSQCIYPVLNCLLYDYSNSCYQCSQGYYLKEKVCYSNDVTCALYDIIGRCIKCVDTYYLINTQCVFPALGYDPYCIVYVNSYCTQCLLGFYLDNYRCSEVDSRCLMFNYTTLLCQNCGRGLQSNGANCI